MNEEEKVKFVELLNEAKTKNGERIKSVKETYFWRVRDLNKRKFYLYDAESTTENH